jgi:hypothetical protein
MFRLLILINLLSCNLFAQTTVGLKASQLNNSGFKKVGPMIEYKTADGLIVPVAIELGKNVQQISAGFGYSGDISRDLELSISTALSNIRFSEEIKSINDEDRNRFLGILKGEINYELSHLISLGVNIDLDMFNWLTIDNRKSTYTAQELKDRKYTIDSNGTVRDSYGSIQKIDYYIDQSQRNNSVKSAENRSATGFGLTLKVNLANSQNE